MKPLSEIFKYASVISGSIWRLWKGYVPIFPVHSNQDSNLNTQHMKYQQTLPRNCCKYSVWFIFVWYIVGVKTYHLGVFLQDTDYSTLGPAYVTVKKWCSLYQHDLRTTGRTRAALLFKLMLFTFWKHFLFQNSCLFNTSNTKNVLVEKNALINETAVIGLNFGDSNNLSRF